MNKRAIELTINFIVLFILSMAMFATGIMIMRNLFHKVDVIKDKLTEQQRVQLERILSNSPDKIVALFSSKEIKSGEHDVFGIGVRNDLDHDANFYIDIECDAAFDRKKATICDDDTANNCNIYDIWMKATPGPYLIKHNDKLILDIFAMVPKNAPKGTFIFNVRIREGSTTGTQYGTTKKLNVIV